MASEVGRIRQTLNRFHQAFGLDTHGQTVGRSHALKAIAGGSAGQRVTVHQHADSHCFDWRQGIDAPCGF